ncbi:hypothetical protein EHQ43_11705 [Leptospira bouyouniensis]|uniref:Lipoprotein n=1 Tax=Leptospira bouyouniensis TaxID=2484911 RepID=A0A7I0HPI3_9LEPT|nr:hypothetical protein [Leptospira bouyouniensis]TGL04063.1 hypothetical protein EHQ43_11705 [Leptospira bouyouniensis]
MKLFRILAISLIWLSVTGCLDIFQTIEIGKENVLTSFIRIKAYLPENKEKVFTQNSTLGFYDYPDLKVKTSVNTKDN